MSERFYSDARLYDRLFRGGEEAVDFYRTAADRQGGSVLELGCGTGHKLIPIASDGHPRVGLDLSPDMLAEAQRKPTSAAWRCGGCRATCASSTWARRSTSCSSPPTHCSICSGPRTW